MGNYILRHACIQHMDLDIIGVAETHLRNEKGLDFPGYAWFGHNRTVLHHKAKCGSGGVGFLIKDCIMSRYHVSVFDNNNEGTLWLKLTDKIASSCNFLICVCYLPPEYSTRNVDASDFFDTLMLQIASYKDYTVGYICGDFNSRCSSLLDFIEGTDTLPHRDVIDNVVNNHGRLMCDFLINANYCILNGRNDELNDFTCVSVKGSSVVDYCVCPYESVNNICNFKVFRPSTLIQESGSVGTVDAKCTAKIDHSFLVWTYDIDISCDSDDDFTDTSHPEESYVRYDTTAVPDNFLSNTAGSLQDVIHKLELSGGQQLDIDDAFNNFRTAVKQEMDSTLPRKRIMMSKRNDRKRRRCKKPWWNDSLTDSWNDMCSAERSWCKQKGPRRKHLRHVYVQKRKHFDRAVRRAKRQHTQDTMRESHRTL